MTDESQDLKFPDRGVVVSTAASEQPADSTAVGVNVRISDTLADRMRGGSRPGLVKLLAAQPAGATKTQHLNTVAHFNVDATLAVKEQDGITDAPGGLITDTITTSNAPDGPTPTVPGGGGPSAPTSPPFPSGFNRRTPAFPPAPQPRKRPDKGSGIQTPRSVGPSSPPPPPPPGMSTRTYYPYDVNHATELFGVFQLGPVTLPLTPPTDLSLIAMPIDYFGDSFNPDGSYTAWGGVGLPTVAEINAMMTSWLSSPPPYETSVDT